MNHLFRKSPIEDNYVLICDWLAGFNFPSVNYSTTSPQLTADIVGHLQPCYDEMVQMKSQKVWVYSVQC